MSARIVVVVGALIALGCGSGPAESGAETTGTTERRMHHRHGHHHDFSDVERFAAIFDDPARDEWQRPVDVISMLSITEEMTVADLGAGTGYFLPHLSSAVGADGHVLALDVEENMVTHMRERAASSGLANVEARVIETTDVGLEEASVDRVLVVDTWHHIADRGAYSAALRRSLRPGGFVLVVDFTRDAPEGPPPAMRITAEQVVAELTEGGLAAEILEEELPRQYVVRGSLPVE